MSLLWLDIGSLIAIVGLAITVVKLYLDQRRTKKEVELSKRGLRILSNLAEAYQKEQASQASQLQLKKEMFEFEKWKAATKIFGWIWERMEED